MLQDVETSWITLLKGRFEKYFQPYQNKTDPASFNMES